MGKISEKSKRLPYLIISLCVNLGILFVFKYFNFFNSSISLIADKLNIIYNIPSLKVLLPVGISFYTFQILSYSIDVYRGEKEYEKHFGVFALYVAFFPQLVAGPIERSKRLLPQFRKKHSFKSQNAVIGLRLILWGMFKKVVIADRLAIFVDSVYGNAYEYNGITFILATLFFAFQIYCDFSAYSDIAIGSARIMGFKIMENFKQPYFSKSLNEFWKRWHISLSSWLRDYLYIPLGGNRVSRIRQTVNIMIVFFLCGLWHGANWTFIAWGIYHGMILLIYLSTNNIRELIYKKVPQLSFFNGVIVFLFISAGWIFFRAENMQEAGYIISTLGTLNISLLNQFIKNTFGIHNFIIAMISLFALINIELIVKGKGHLFNLFHRSHTFRWIVYYALISSIALFGVFGKNEFIYFQF